MNPKFKKIVKKIIVCYLPEGLSRYLQKIYYSRLISNYKESREPELAVIKNLVKDGDCVMDIGANIGVYTKFLSQFIGPQGKLISIEPIPRTFDILCNNIRRLRFNNIKAINCACNDTNGSVVMEIPCLKETGGEDFYYARIPLSNYPVNNWRKINVESKTIDLLLAEVSQRLAFIKCDAEGNENKILRGALNTLLNFKPALLIEIVKDPDEPTSPAHETFSFLKNYGYQPFYFDGDKLLPRKEGIRKMNYFFLTNEHILKLNLINKIG